MSRHVVHSDCSEITEDMLDHHGDCCTLHTNNSLIKGDENFIYGDNNVISGDGNVVYGDNNVNKGGDGNVYHGKNNKLVSGDGCILNGNDYTPSKKNVPKFKKSSTTFKCSNIINGGGSICTSGNIRAEGKGVTMNQSATQLLLIMTGGGVLYINNTICHYEANKESNPIIWDLKTMKQTDGPMPILYEKDEVKELTRPSINGRNINIGNAAGNGSRVNIKGIVINGGETYTIKDDNIQKQDIRNNKRKKEEETKIMIPESKKEDLLPEEGDESDACIICAEKRKSTVFVPCGHVTMCNMCCINYLNHNKDKPICPVCKKDTNGACNLYT